MTGNEPIVIRRIKAGDSGAFEELYKLHYYSLRMYAKLMLSDREAEDVVQDVFINLWLHRETLNEALSVRAYLFRSVYNSSLNVIRNKRRTEPCDDLSKREIEEMGADYYYDPDRNNVITDLYAREARSKIHSAIDSLPPRCKEVFSLSYFDGLPGKEISRKLGISLSTVENHINNAFKILRKKLLSYKNDLLILLVLLYKMLFP